MPLLEAELGIYGDFFFFYSILLLEISRKSRLSYHYLRPGLKVFPDCSDAAFSLTTFEYLICFEAVRIYKVRFNIQYV